MGRRPRPSRPSRARHAFHAQKHQSYSKARNSRQQSTLAKTLKPGKKYSGPAIITEYSATTVIPPRKGFQLDKAANLMYPSKVFLCDPVSPVLKDFHPDC